MGWNDNNSVFKLITYHVSDTVLNVLHVLTHKNPLHQWENQSSDRWMFYV